MLGFIYALLSAIFFSTNNIFLKKTTQKIEIHTAFLMIYFFVTLTALIISFFLGNYNHTFDFMIFLKIVLIGFVGAIAIFSLMESFSRISVAKSLAIANFYPFISLFLFYLFYLQKISLFNFISMLIVFFGIILTLDGKFKLKFNKNLLFPITTAIGWGIYYFLLDI